MLLRIRLRWDNNSGGGDVGTLGNSCASIGHQEGCTSMDKRDLPPSNHTNAGRRLSSAYDDEDLNINAVY